MHPPAGQSSRAFMQHLESWPDPFEGVWCDVLSWLQEDLDASAVVLLGRLQEAEPDRFSRAHSVRCSAGCSSGAASWPKSWSTPLLVSP